MLSWSLFAAALAVVGFLILKLFLMKKDLNLLCAEFGEHLSSDTNTLLSVSSGDRQVRALAAQLNQQLRQLQALRQTYEHGDREIKDAVTSISHDLRTPLTAICGYLELLKREEMPDNAARYLSYIENRTTAMKTLTEELFFRGYLTSHFRIQKWFTPILIAVLFSLYHFWLPFNNIFRILVFAPVTYVAYKKKNIYISMCFHCMCNLFSVIGFVLEVVR